MGDGFSETPLAIFTTLAPMGACAFIVIFAALKQAADDAERIKRIDKMTVIPLIFLLVGFVGAFLHLKNPLAALGVVNGVGRSPLTNEVMVGGFFFLAAIVYWLLALKGKLSTSGRKVFLIVLSIWAVVFAAFCGIAYMIDTVPTWNTPWSIVQMLGYGLMGGAAVGSLTLRAGDVDLDGKLGDCAFWQSVAGAVLGVAGFGGQIAACSGMSNMWGNALDLVPAIWVFLAMLVVSAVIAVWVQATARKKQVNTAVFGAVVMIVAICVFFARIGFYGLFMSLAL